MGSTGPPARDPARSEGAVRAVRRTLAPAAPRLARRLWEQRVSRESRRALEALAAGPRPIVAGPWLSEIGFELLYWLPLLRWLAAEHGLGPEDVVAVSRGGADPWYADVAGTYVDLLDHFGAEELQAWQRQRLGRAGSEKQGSVTAVDAELLALVRDRLGLAQAGWLHPALMYRLLNVIWAWTGNARLATTHARYAPIRREALPAAPELGLPAGAAYVAVKAYFSACFPDTDENRAFLERLVATLAAERAVVLLRTAFAVDEHVAWSPRDPGGIVDTAPLLEPRTNLALQSAIVAGASGLVATYGGFAYLGPQLGVPTLSFYSQPTFNPVHEAVAADAARALGRTPEPPLRVSDLDGEALRRWLDR